MSITKMLPETKIDLKKIREENDWTQQELADVLGCSRSYVATIEVGLQTVSINMLHAIIQKLGLKYEELFE